MQDGMSWRGRKGNFLASIIQYFFIAVGFSQLITKVKRKALATFRKGKANKLY